MQENNNKTRRHTTSTRRRYSRKTSIEKKQPMGASFLVTMASFTIVVAGMRAAESLVVPLLLSAFFAIISAPPLIFLERKGIPAGLAILIVLLGLISVVAGIGIHDTAAK